jgi:hypothetical protein
MRLQTRFVDPAVTLPDDIPAYRLFPPRFVLKLIGARMAMFFG